MKEDTNQNEIINLAIAQLKGLRENETESRMTREVNTGPAVTDEARNAIREQFIDKLYDARVKAKGRHSYMDRVALEKYADMKVKALGPGMWFDCFDEFEVGIMMEYACNATKGALYEFVGMDDILCGPIQENFDVLLPETIFPKYAEAPKNEATTLSDPGEANYDGLVEPQRMTETEIGEYASSHALTIQEAIDYCENRYLARKDEYDSKKRALDWKQEQHDIWVKYNLEFEEWKGACANLDEKAAMIETALALGAMTFERIPQTQYQQNNFFRLTYLDENGDLVQIVAGLTTAADLKACAYENISKVAPFYTSTHASDDLLAALTVGDVEVVSNAKDSIKVIQYELAGGNGEEATITDISKLNQGVVGYQRRVQVKYNHADGKVSDVVQEYGSTSKATKYIRTESGALICPACGQEVVEDSHDSVVEASSFALQRLENKIQYRAGYVSWEKINAAASLAKASLEAIGEGDLTEPMLTALFIGIDEFLNKDSNMAMKFLNKFTSICASSRASDGNVAKVKEKLVKEYVLTSATKKMADAICPVCGQDKPSRRHARGKGKLKDSTPEPPPTQVSASSGVAGLIAEKDAWGRSVGGPYTVDYEALSPEEELHADGSQQAWNPFAPNGAAASWTRYSFRPCDAILGYPMISIIPASFQSIASISTILNEVPYIKVMEYFMRNNVSAAINMFQGLAEGADKQDSQEANQPATIKDNTKSLIDIIKEKFTDGLDPKNQVIDLPFKLYHKLKAKLYGNTYIFPYIPKENPITQSSNKSEWNEEGGILQALTSGLQGAVNGAAGMLGIGIAKPFPAPTWKLPSDGWKWTMSFNLNLINDEYFRTRCNYMCANTLINNNRWIQKTILGFPGALYEVAVPTGVRELMCTGEFVLTGLGNIRNVPPGFFDEPTVIGSRRYVSVKMHSDAWEVLPDAYSLKCTFESCIAENLNNSVFSYYLEMVDFPPASVAESVATGAVAAARDGGIAGLLGTLSDPPNLTPTLPPAEAYTRQDDAAKIARGQAAVDAATTTTTEAPASKSSRRPAISLTIPDKVSRDPFRWDETMERYSKVYESVRSKLKLVKEEMEEKRKKLEKILLKRSSLPMNGIRKTYSKREMALNKDLTDLMGQVHELESELIELQMKVLLHGKDKVKERTESAELIVPVEFFEIPQPDDVTLLKIKFMTREERKAFIASQKAKIAKLDKWGISKCKDLPIRAVVAKFISQALEELWDQMVDVYETDPNLYDKYYYRYEMLSEDFNALFDASKPFLLNKTNIVHIPVESLPPEFLGLIDESVVPSGWPEEDDEQPAGSTALVEKEPEVRGLVPISKDEVIADKEELIKQHREEVVKQAFGSEEELAHQAFVEAMNRTREVQGFGTQHPCENDRWAIVLLKNSLDLDWTSSGNKKNIVTWFGEKAGISGEDQGKYKDVHERMIMPVANGGMGIGEFSPQASDRATLIRLITQDLYRYVDSCRFVLLANAMDTVSTKAGKVLKKVTQEFMRLENGSAG